MNQASRIAVVIFLLFSESTWSDDWPQWRGPMRDGVWNENGTLQSFPPNGLKVLWRRPVGLGLSSPIVAQGRVFVTDVDLTHTPTKERVHCFEAASGVPVWTYAYEAVYPERSPDQFIQGPIPTPICHDGKVYTIGRTELLCLNAVDGKLVWKKSLDKDYNSQESLTYASPLIEGNLLIIYSGRFSQDETKCVIAIDKDSGTTAWRAVTDYAAMSSPIVVTAAHKRQLIVWSQRAVTSLDTKTGEEYWREATRPVNQSSAVSTPVVQGNRLLIGGLMMELNSDEPTATVLWPQVKSPTRRNLSNTSTPLFRGDHIFSARTSGHFVCLDATTGSELWRIEGVTDLVSGASIHLTTNGDNTFLYTDKGELILSRLSGEGYQEISRAQLLEPTFPYQGRKFVWAPPAYANRCVFARSDNELVCATLAE